MSLTKILLDERQMPRQWYNIMADMPNPPAPPLHPATGQPVGPDDLAPLFPMAIIEQEVSQERWIDIPEEVLDIYRLWRPSPLYGLTGWSRRSRRRLRSTTSTRASAPTGSHKPNTAVAQAYYNKKEGVKRLATETGAGQWGSALSLACSLFGLECTVYMVKVSYQQKPYRRSLMQVWGAEVIASPSTRTQSGRKILEADPDSPGSLGIAISEAAEDAATHDDTKYALGSVLNHVLMHQTVIGLEAKAQLELVNDYPDVVIGACGGGSNFGGLAFPFLADKFAGERGPRVAVEPTACPTLTKGHYAYDYGDTAKLAPMMLMYTLGHSFVPPGIHAGGLRYHGDSPLVSQLYHEKLIEAKALPQRKIFEGAALFARTEGILPAPESAHAIQAAIEEALEAKEAGEPRTILFGLSGHGHFDLAAYDQYLAGKLEDYEYPEELIEKALQDLPKVPN